MKRITKSEEAFWSLLALAIVIVIAFLRGG